MSGFDPHWEALPGPQRSIWPQLAPALQLGLVLYGGTAIALRLGHRTSIDFDFFTQNPIDPEELGRHFVFLRQAQVIQQQKNTLTVLAASQGGSVKISFFGDIGFGRVGSPELTSDQLIKVASLEDLLATKLKVLLQRVESKDYRDIVAILRRGVALETGLAAAVSMYSPNFQPSEAMKALTYFEGGDVGSLPPSERDYLIRAVSRIRSIPVVGVVSRSLS